MLNRRLHRLACVYTCQNATLLEITCQSSYMYVKVTLEVPRSILGGIQCDDLFQSGQIIWRDRGQKFHSSARNYE